VTTVDTCDTVSINDTFRYLSRAHTFNAREQLRIVNKTELVGEDILLGPGLWTFRLVAAVLWSEKKDRCRTFEVVGLWDDGEGHNLYMFFGREVTH
jgi:hypothetical protein